MRKIEWKRILLAKEYFYTSLFNFQSEQLVVNVAENIKLKIVPECARGVFVYD